MSQLSNRVFSVVTEGPARQVTKCWGPVRLGQLGRLIPSASKKVLIENLRELESHGLIVRKDLSGTIRHVEYDFTEVMRPAMTQILDHLAEFGGLRLSHPEDGRTISDAQIPDP
jgi:DNA-binding HxlR family transcriptional regulator